MEGKKGKALGRSPLGRGLSALISTPPVNIFNRPEVSGNTAAALQIEPANKIPGEPYKAPPPIAEVSTSDGGTHQVRLVPIEQVQNNPSQPRQDFTETELIELSDSIKSLGILQPILVRPSTNRAGSIPEARYEIVAGERRWRAAQRAGLTQLPIIIKDLDERQTLEIAIVENVQRENLNPVEQALGFQRLMDEFKLNQQEVAEKVGKDRASIANFVRLLKLPAEAQTLLREGKLSTGHAKALLSIREPSAQLRLAKKCVEEGLSVRALEGIVSRAVVLDSGRRSAPKEAEGQSSNASFPEVTDRLRSVLGTKVQIHTSKTGSGKIEINYFSEQELERIVEHICKEA